MSTEAQRAPVPPRPSAPPPPNPATRLPDTPPPATPQQPAQPAAPVPQPAAPAAHASGQDPAREPDARQPDPAYDTPAWERTPKPPAPDAGAQGTPAAPPPPAAPPRPPARPAAPQQPSETTARLRPIPSGPPAGSRTQGAAEGTQGGASRAQGAASRAQGGADRPQGAASRAQGGAGALPPEAPPRPPQTPPRPDLPPPSRTAAQTRATGAAPIPPRPGAGQPFAFGQPPTYDDLTAVPRPDAARGKPRLAAIAACLVLGLGLIGGAVTGSWLTDTSDETPTAQALFTEAGEIWHNEPVDKLFPPKLKGDGAGPGGADRRWTRIGVAPDSSCKNAFDPLLYKALKSVGCARLLRATYTDATHSYVTTVGMVFTTADAAAMGDLRSRFGAEDLDERDDLMPRPYAPKGTVAADFTDAQRASWRVSVLTDAPVVVYAVSGFADGRKITEPEPAERAMKAGRTSAPAQSGLGHEAKGIADRVERTLRKTFTVATETPS